MTRFWKELYCVWRNYIEHKALTLLMGINLVAIFVMGRDSGHLHGQ